MILKILMILLLWFGIGSICALLCTMYDFIVYKAIPDKKTTKGAVFMIILGFISLPVSCYLVITDIIEIYKKKHKKGRRNIRRN